MRLEVNAILLSRRLAILPLPCASAVCRRSTRSSRRSPRWLPPSPRCTPLRHRRPSTRGPPRAALEASLKGEPAGFLAGVPVAIKDLALTKGLRTTSGSRLYADYVPSHDDIVVERLKQAGAIVIGKTNAAACPGAVTLGLRQTLSPVMQLREPRNAGHFQEEPEGRRRRRRQL